MRISDWSSDVCSSDLVVAFAGPFADAGEDGVAAMRLRDVVDQLHDRHGLADAGAAEEADLAALGVGRQQVDDLDAGDQHLGLGPLVDIVRGGPVDRRRPLADATPALLPRITANAPEP